MAWPRSAIWGRRTNAVRAEIDRVARTICAYEPVRLLYDPDDCGALPQVAAIEQVAGHYDDIWLRDTGPILTRDEAIVCRFNGWGGRVREIGRAACRERGCEYVWLSVGGGS